MPPEATIPDWRADSLAARLPQQWRLPLARLALAWAGLILLTGQAWLGMADKWWNDATYNHAMFVPLISGWLVWTRREILQKLQPQGWWPGLVLLAGALMLWLLGTLAGINTAIHLGAVAALIATVPTLLGPRVTYALLFPLAYLLFLVPFGGELVPALQMITAEIVIFLTELSGIQAHIDGVFIDTPVGLFEVAEACSGVKFLIAMLALGVLVAQTCFTSWKRRAVFMATALALPILANGVRAWGTIAIAQVQGIEFAEGFDHVFYGWVFFALVVAALFAVFWRWFDRDPEDPGIDLEMVQSHAWVAKLETDKGNANAALAGIAIVAVLFAGWASLASRVEAQLPAAIAAPVVDGWQQVPYEPQVAWEPQASGADQRVLQRYRNAQGQEVDLFVALYAAQEDGREASAYGDGALPLDTPWRWLEAADAPGRAKGDYLLANGQVKRLAHTTYRHGDLATGSAAKLKLAVMRDRLLLRARPTVLVIVSAEEQPGSDMAEMLAAFRQSAGDDAAWMDRIAAGR